MYQPYSREPQKSTFPLVKVFSLRADNVQGLTQAFAFAERTDPTEGPLLWSLLQSGLHRAPREPGFELPPTSVLPGQE